MDMPQAQFQEIRIEGPVTLTLSPQAMAAVLDGLAEMPFKRVQPVMGEIVPQLQAAMQAQAAKLASNGAEKPAVPN